MTKPILHQWEISPFCQKVAKALQHKGIAYEVVNYNGVLGSKVPRLSKVGKLPVLDIDGQRIQDSTRIARYLDELFPDAPRLYPEQTLAKTQVEIWEDWSDEYLYWYEVYFRVNDDVALAHAVQISTMGRPAYERKLLKPLLKTALSAQLYMQGLGRMAKTDVEAEFFRHLDRLESVLTLSTWLVGEQRTIADIAVATQLNEMLRTSVPMRAAITKRQKLMHWLSRV
ncbi:glutathione S-transferase family protein [Agitococcus lubricus]|uniref:Glutathione S-transferase n=1 Tax=Agitococcus lubricus TaxID=1077255 RepID=A0A2T5IYF6_9GAMM|nr:glutathione S-transferase family protein [Agitococcus lubricus]PTQ88924.1 glutathione S-transferase [Agitococcus lubricus]